MKKENHNITLNKTNSLNSSLNSTSKYKNTSGFADKLVYNYLYLYLFFMILLTIK